jgi:transposase
MRPVRDTLRRRMLVTRQATQTVLSLQSMVMRQTGGSVSAAKMGKWTEQEVHSTFEDDHSRCVAMEMVELLRYQRKVQHRLERQALSVVKEDEAFLRLQTIPGIGRVLALTIVLETGPIERFRSAGNYASYCRMVNSVCESDGKKKGENNRKNGNRYLGWAYVEAANFAARYSARAEAWLNRKQARCGRVVAVKALGCKLSKGAYYVLRDGVAFEEQKLFG